MINMLDSTGKGRTCYKTCNEDLLQANKTGTSKTSKEHCFQNYLERATEPLYLPNSVSMSVDVLVNSFYEKRLSIV